MYQLKKNEMNKIATIFEGWNDTLVWSCMQGYMGNAWVDDAINPKSAQIITGDFCFFAGIANDNLVRNIPTDFPSDCILMVPPTNEWAKLIEQVYGCKAEAFMRYAIKKENNIFDEEKLRNNISILSSEYNIRKIDEELYNKVLEQEWSRDLCSQFPNYSFYENYGMGYVAIHKDMIVCGASSYTVYDGGIEIEIDTLREYRRKGLALACASKLILECLEKDIYPSWDAANMASVALASKLGYHLDKEYVTYAVTKF